MDCYQRHKQKTLCDSRYRCCHCRVRINLKERPNGKEEHICGEYKCVVCKLYVLKPHDCFIWGNCSDLTKLKVTFFDFECRQDEIRQCEQGYVPNNADRCNTCKYKITKCLSCLRCKNCLVETCGRNVHIPNLVIAHSACAMCEYDSIDDETKCSFCGSRCDHCVSSSGGEYAREPCLDCGYRKVVFKGDATLAKFGEWLFNCSHKNFTVMSHGGKIYDNVFILNYLLDLGKAPIVTYNVASHGVGESQG